MNKRNLVIILCVLGAVGLAAYLSRASWIGNGASAQGAAARPRGVGGNSASGPPGRSRSMSTRSES